MAVVVMMVVVVVAAAAAAALVVVAVVCSHMCAFVRFTADLEEGTTIGGILSYILGNCELISVLD